MSGHRLREALAPWTDRDGCVHVDDPDDMPAFIAAILAAAPAPGLDVDLAIRLQKIADELVPGIRHDFGLEAVARLAAAAPAPPCDNCGAVSWSYEGRDEPICAECGHVMPLDPKYARLAEGTTEGKQP